MEKKRVIVSVIILLLIAAAAAYAFDGRRQGGHGPGIMKGELLARLPAEKEMIFHQTMRESREKAAPVKDEIKRIREEMDNILTAPEFDEGKYLAKTRELRDGIGKLRSLHDEALVKLAKLFTFEERAVLAHLLQGPGMHSCRMCPKGMPCLSTQSVL